MEDLIGYVVDGQSCKKTWVSQIDKIKSKLKILFCDIENINRETIYLYNLYHDCGKPFCIEFDEQNKRHFPNHEFVSYNKWLEYGGDDFIGELILHDMDIHRMTVSELSNVFSSLAREQWVILIFAALAEVHSNAEMFGGIESVSFKIKLKKILKNIDCLIKLLA